MTLKSNEVQDFWTPYECEITSFKDLFAAITKLTKKSEMHSLEFAWRGQANAAWPLHSSLYRRVKLLDPGGDTSEADMQIEETKVLTELHRWGLHTSSAGGRLSVLNQLAILQHYGAPTRLIDITFNAWVAAWFAVEQKWKNGKLDTASDNTDSRIFAIEISTRKINESAAFRSWEDGLSRPWKYENMANGDTFKKDWETTIHAWKPSNLDGRISAQNGGFLLGGVPSVATTGTSSFQIPKGTAAGGSWKKREVRLATCLAVRPHKFNAKHGGATKDAMFTFRIKAEAKAEIRNHLEMMFGYRHATIYPDFTGFAQFGVHWLPNY